MNPPRVAQTTLKLTTARAGMVCLSKFVNQSMDVVIVVLALIRQSTPGSNRTADFLISRPVQQARRTGKRNSINVIESLACLLDTSGTKVASLRSVGIERDPDLL